jgi:isoleucyl-tRNA synthetase
MDVNFMESIWWVFKQLWEQGRIYKDYRIMPYSWKLTTPLSNFEAGSNYKTVQDPAITIRMKLTREFDWSEPTYALAWTTTPWTLPSNLALCAGPEIDYVAVLDKGEQVVYLLAKSRLEAYYPKGEGFTVKSEFKGADLLDWAYEPLLPFFGDHPNAFRILNDDFVTTEDGTGLVHLAPAYGEDDYRVCRAVDITLVDPLDESCNFTDAIPEWAGQFCKDADKAIIRRLKDDGKLVHQSTIQHSYPFDDRTDTPLIYRAIDAWYVRVEDIRDKLCRHNDSIHWVPEYVGEKRFGNWLKEARDWNISRNRYWGSCIPIWVAEDGSDMICVGSIDELEQLSGQRVDDLHKHIVDKVTFEKDGKTYRRTPEVLDCWFESGAMPYAQAHYPFENKEQFDQNFPADFIAEGLDQTRGWFYTLTILSTLLFDRPAFKNVVVNGLVLAEDGRKMSKRLKNYPDPNYVMDEYGADALRLYMIHSPIVRAEDLRFSEEGVKHALRHLLIPWWNAYSFFVTYANIDGWTSSTHEHVHSDNELDQWILSSMETLIARVTKAMDRYDLQSSVRPFITFIEDLTNWYIRRSRRRFWKSSNDEDKQQAYQTLYYVLLQLSKVSAPFVPFISEAIYRNLRTEEMPESVHLCDFPTADESLEDPDLERRMQRVMEAVSLGRQLRTDYNVKVRQPLHSLHIVSRDPGVLADVQALEGVLLDELNVKELRTGSDEQELAVVKAKLNFKRVGPRLGKKVKQASEILAGLPSQEIQQGLEGEGVAIDLDGESILFTEEDLQLERKPKAGLAVAAQGELVVALETALRPELIEEGLAREFVNKIQNMRKLAELDVTQRIAITYASSPELEAAVKAYQDYVQSETLALECESSEPDENAQEWDLNGHSCRISIQISP